MSYRVTNKQNGFFTHDDEGLLRVFAREAAVAIENYQLYERLTLSNAQKSALLDIAASIGGTLDLGTLIRKVRG